MSSRELKETEITNYPLLKKHVVAKDGIAVIIHPSNEISNLKLQTLRLIYLGSIETWSNVVGVERNILNLVTLIKFNTYRTKLSDIIRG